MLRERKDIGRAIPRSHEEWLLEAVKVSASPTLWPSFVLSMDSGLRASEVRALRRMDLDLEWRDRVIVQGTVRVPKSKTEDGTRRTIPLSSRVAAIPSLWLSRFEGAPRDAFVFPHHQVVLERAGAGPVTREVELHRPTGEWKSAWATARKAAGLHYRWHDLRHTLVSRLAENPHVSEQTIMALAGHVSKNMLERSSHIRTHAERAAIAALEVGRAGSDEVDREDGGGAEMGRTRPCRRRKK